MVSEGKQRNEEKTQGEEQKGPGYLSPPVVVNP
jgi:hypothetical protein